MKDETRNPQNLTLRTLVVKNIIKTLQRYVGYMMSTSIAVTVVFMFAAFVANPSVEKGYMTQTARQILMGSEVIIIALAVFFVYFFHGALLRQRSKEFGLLMTLGMRPRQIGRMVLLEGWALGIAALGIGGVLGLVLLKLFLMAIGRILDIQQPIPFAVPLASLWLVGIVFGVLFLVDGFVQSWRIRRRTPKTLILAGQTRQKAPRVRRWLVAAALLMLAVAYYLAVGQSRELTKNFFPILILTTLGTYFLFTQVSVFVLRRIQHKPRTGLIMLLAGRLAQRIRDHALVLTVVTQLSAIVLSGMGAVFGTSSIVTQNSLHVAPYSVMVAQRQADPATASSVVGSTGSTVTGGATTTPLLSAEKMYGVLRQHGLTITGTAQALTFTADIRPQQSGGSGGQAERNAIENLKTLVISSSDFRHLQDTIENTQPALGRYLSTVRQPANGHAVLVAPYPLAVGQLFPNQLAQLRLPHAGGVVPVKIDKQIDTTVIDMPNFIGLPSYMLIVSNQDFAHWQRQVGPGYSWQLNGLMVTNWKQTDTALHALGKLLPAGHGAGAVSTNTANEQTRHMLSIMLFAGFFVSLLFFVASGSSLYFRAQTQEESDRKQFRALHRLGMRSRELKSLIAIEFAAVFFVPVVVASVHSTFAILTLNNMLNVPGNIWPMYLIVVGVYALCIAVYYGVAAVRYTGRLGVVREE